MKNEKHTCLENVCKKKTGTWPINTAQVRCSPRESNLVASAAMDHTVQLWDLRQRDFVGACPGALVSGDALDIDASGQYLSLF